MNSTVPGSDLESIPCLGKFVPRRVNRVLSETRTMHASWLKVQEIRRFVFAESLVENRCRCLFLSLHTYPSSCLRRDHQEILRRPGVID